MTFSKRTTIKTAWLVTRQEMGSVADIEQVELILNYRMSPNTVLRATERRYVHVMGSLEEILSYTRNRSSWPYLAEYGQRHGVRYQGEILCGHNPVLFARMVENLRIGSADGETILRWRERPFRRPGERVPEGETIEQDSLGRFTQTA